MIVHHLNCATMCPLAARWVLGVERMVAHCLVVETARDGLVLIDTGFGTRDIALVPMHGHTRGHSAVVVGTGARWLVHAGDAYFHRAAIAGDAQPIGFAAFERATQMNAPARRASLAALRQLRASYDDLDVFC